MAASNSGSLIVSGSPDKLIKLWDPSNPSGPVQTLKGHTDGVRDLLVSSDGRLILSASSDKTVKLWTAAMPNRCVATYSHFEDSAWTLYSNSRDLSTFWVGCRDGWVMKLRQGASVDCLAICKETAPVLKIAGINDSFVWTATTQTDVKCWVINH